MLDALPSNRAATTIFTPRAAHDKIVSRRGGWLNDPSIPAAQLARAAVESADRDNKRALARKVVIEERKEKAERAALAAEQEEADRRLLQQRINDSVEEQRRKDEMCVLLASGTGPAL
jgi:hypothetical protein